MRASRAAFIERISDLLCARMPRRLHLLAAEYQLKSLRPSELENDELCGELRLHVKKLQARTTCI